MHLQNDEPTLFDRLQRTELLHHLGQDIATCSPPHVFGVHGDWGAGKTSFLNQLQVYLTGACPQQPPGELQYATAKGLAVGPNTEHVTVVWFEAWRYQHERAPIVALLQEIRTQLPWYSKALNEGRKLGEVAIQSALLAFEDITKKIGIQAAKIQDVGEKWEKDNLATALPSHMIREHLEVALSKLLGDKSDAPRPRLVVMVDDLDRCESEAAYKLLEGIKIYLNLPNCVFVLGMNQKVIEGAIANHLPKNDDGSLQALRAREYLGKICQDIHHLPMIAKPDKLLEDFLDSLPDASVIFATMAEFRCLPRNARKIRAFSNLLRRYVPRFAADLADTTKRDETAKLVVIFSCLYQFHPDLYRILETDARFYGIIYRFARGEANVHPVFKSLQRLDDPVATDKGETTATPEPTLAPAFSDPAEGNVLRVQNLIAKFRPVTETEVERFLVR